MLVSVMIACPAEGEQPRGRGDDARIPSPLSPPTAHAKQDVERDSRRKECRRGRAVPKVAFPRGTNREGPPSVLNSRSQLRKTQFPGLREPALRIAAQTYATSGPEGQVPQLNMKMPRRLPSKHSEKKLPLAGVSKQELRIQMQPQRRAGSEARETMSVGKNG